MTTRKIYFENQSCMDRSDEIALIQSEFTEKGFTFTEEVESANFIFIYSCGVTIEFANMMQKNSRLSKKTSRQTAYFRWLYYRNCSYAFSR